MDGSKQASKLVVTLTSDRQKILPTCDSDTVLANKVSAFFCSKVTKIRDALDNMTIEEPRIILPEVSYSLTTFQAVSEASVRKVILKSPTKSSTMDPIPTSVLKIPQILDTLLSVLSKAMTLCCRAVSPSA